jgi:DEAD/DEAH box helicase domain-containing protein
LKHSKAGNIDEFISEFQQDLRYARTIVAASVTGEKTAERACFPQSLFPPVTRLFGSLGIETPYTHQATALDSILQGKNVVLSTGVASGKSLCYQAAILNSILSHPGSRSLLLFPTKALAQDQAQKMQALASALCRQNPKLPAIYSGIYDGDTPNELRGKLRKQANILFSNPDMLHLGILPNHSLWSAFLSQLHYVVIDEVHMYRGVFGSHVANVLRRLKRIAAVYGVSPQFIFTSATLANAKEHAEALAEEPVELVENDGSPHGERHFLICNPPLIEPALGIRKSSYLEVAGIAKRFLDTDLQAILFSETRRSVEILYRYFLDERDYGDRVKTYRSGYLAADRRQVETGLRSQKLNLVISTNALELGIDIGGLDAIFLNGYPGTICGTRQQAGRAGRQGSTSLCIMVAGANPLDQYICQHPEYIFANNPEQALIDPNNSEILRQQLLCAVSEMALKDGDGFGFLRFENIVGHLNSLVDEGKLKHSGNRYTGIQDAYPAVDVSLRNAGNQFQIMAEDEQVGWVDSDSVKWMTHPQAIYLHQGETWIVQKLDLEDKKVLLQPIEASYFTQTIQHTEIALNDLLQIANVPGGRKHFGRVTVTRTVVGFKKLRFYTQEVLDQEELDLPPSIMQTEAWWLSLSEDTVNRIRAKGLWNNDANNYGKGWSQLCATILDRDGHKCRNCGVSGDLEVHHIVPFRRFEDAFEANNPDNLVSLCPRCHRLAEQRVHMQSGLAAVAYLIGNLAPFFVMCDNKNLGVFSEDKSPLAMGNPVVCLYDNIPGGIGLSRRLHELHDRLLYAALDRVKGCACENGCPACVGPVAENGLGAKEEAIAILQELQ